MSIFENGKFVLSSEMGRLRCFRRWRRALALRDRRDCCFRRQEKCIHIALGGGKSFSAACFREQWRSQEFSKVDWAWWLPPKAIEFTPSRRRQEGLVASSAGRFLQ